MNPAAASAPLAQGAPLLQAQGERKLTLDEILDLLIQDGQISKEDAKEVRARRHEYKPSLHPLQIIADRRLKTRQPPHSVLHLEALTEWLAGRLGLDYLRIDPLKINFSTVTEVMPAAYAGRLQVLPVEVTPQEVVIASAEPYIRAWEDELQPVLRKRIRRVFSNPVDIERYQIEFYNLARSVKKAAQTDVQRGSAIYNFEQLIELSQTNRQFDANEQHIVSIVDWLWQYAFAQRASDIHVEPRREFGVVRFRIDGVLHQVYQLPMSVINAMTSRIKILGRMDVVEKRRPQDGRVKTRTPEGNEVELRLSTLPTAFGEKLVMRIFDPDVLVRSFSEMGFTDEDLSRWRHMTTQPNGIILVTGPTGSGKTTTLYSTLKQLATPEVNVCTIEDPIEMVEPAFNQMQVQAAIELGFADGVRALMRQDPDIIMIGEIRDRETAEMAIQAALTGHLVLSTLHTNDAPTAITRLQDLGVPSYLINSTLLGVMAQRLVRTLCPHCKQASEPSEEEVRSWATMVAPFKVQPPRRLFHPVGCLECRKTGYIGRMGIYETLLMSPGMNRLIQTNADLAPIRQQAMRDNMKPLRLSGALKIAQGLTSLEEVVRVAPPAQED
ncbi:MAG: GspE/PulE family protein [Halothiobacillaceae bacterium]|jgi:general secretion pathway protein E|nr:GspE/PulE family protein [Halothiobacillaceae bacterium]MDY0049715.1 GspE/PulE family protein [Halothiobacillaceae bacterium]